MPTVRATLALLTLGLLGACAGGAARGPVYPTPEDYPSTLDLELRRATTGPEVDALEQRFWGSEAIEPAALAADIESLLGRYPGNARLHAMGALLATSREDTDARFEHWIRAAADLSSPFTELSLWEALGESENVGDIQVALALVTRLAQDHPRPAARAVAEAARVELLSRIGRVDEARALRPRVGAIDRFLLAGAFDNDQGKGFRLAYAPERGIDVDAPMQGVLVPIRWREAVAIDDRGVVQLVDMVSPASHAVAYLATWVRVPRATAAELRITTSAPLRAWVGGTLVASEEQIERGAFDSLRFPVELAQGWNLVLLKSATERPSRWYLGARLTDAAGATLEGMEVSTEPRPSPPATGEEAPAAVILPEALAELPEGPRRSFLRSRHHARAGRDRLALEDAQALLERAPGNPFAIHVAALAHWSDGEIGRAIDLLNEGIDAHGEWAAGLLLERGRFYRQRDLHDKAIEDLDAAVALSPAGRLSRMELADVLEARGWHEDRCLVLRGTLARWPDSGWARRELGDCMQDRGYLVEATEQYRRAAALEPGNSWALDRLAQLARWRGDYDDALRMSELRRHLEPWRGGHVLQLGDTLRLAGRRDEARAQYARVIEQDPQWASPHSRLAMMAHEDGDEEEALAHWTHALALEPDDTALAERVDYLRAEATGGGREWMPTEADLSDAVERAATIEAHPGAHTIMVLDHEVTLVRHDGSAQRMVSQVWKAVTTEGRDQLIQQTMPPRARILAAYSRAPDGARQEASSIRDGVARFRGLTVGSVVVLQYIHHAPPPPFLPNHFVSSWYFQGMHRQSVDARWIIAVPAHRELIVHTQGSIAHERREEAGMVVHELTASAVPPLVAEPMMQPPGDLLWRAQVSTLSSWDEYVAWERALLSEVFHSDAELRALARRLTDGVTGVRERFDRLFHYVAEEIRYQQDYEDTIAGVRPHSCPVVLERGYGDCKDKAVLLILLARELGIDVHFAILRTTDRGRVVREVPNQQFNHAIVYVPAQEGIEEGFFMDPTTDGLDMGVLRADDQGALSLVLDPRTGEHRFLPIPYQSPDTSYVRYAIDVDIASAQEASARVTVTARGPVGSTLRRVMRNPEQADILQQQVATRLFSGATVRERAVRNVDDIWHPVELDLGLDVSAAIQPEGDARRIDVPQLLGLSATSRLATRRTPMRFGAPDSLSMRLTIRLPRRARLVRGPTEVDATHPCFRVTQRTEVSGRQVTVSLDYARECTELGVDAYPEFRELAQRVANQLDAQIVFR